VKINFDDKIILCDNLDFSFNDNIAVGYGNVTVKNENSIMNADSISLNIKTKDIVINSKNKVNIKVE
jgi:lipopolysaccharide export system protein LptA